MNDRIPVAKINENEKLIIEDVGGNQRVVESQPVEFTPVQIYEQDKENFTAEYADLLVGKSADEIEELFRKIKKPYIKKNLDELTKAREKFRTQYDKQLWEQLLTIALNSENSIDIEQFFMDVRHKEALEVEDNINMSEDERKLKYLNGLFRKERDKIQTDDAMERSEAIAKLKAKVEVVQDEDEVEIEIPEEDKAA